MQLEFDPQVRLKSFIHHTGYLEAVEVEWIIPPKANGGETPKVKFKSLKSIGNLRQSVISREIPRNAELLMHNLSWRTARWMSSLRSVHLDSKQSAASHPYGVENDIHTFAFWCLLQEVSSFWRGRVFRGRWPQQRRPCPLLFLMMSWLSSNFNDWAICPHTVNTAFVTITR